MKIIILRNRWKTEQALGLAASGLFVTTVLHDEEFPIEFTGFWAKWIQE